MSSNSKLNTHLQSSVRIDPTANSDNHRTCRVRSSQWTIGFLEWFSANQQHYFAEENG